MLDPYLRELFVILPHIVMSETGSFDQFPVRICRELPGD